MISIDQVMCMPKTTFVFSVATDQDFALMIAENMQKYGGSFVQELGKCLIYADEENRFLLASAFYPYMREYALKEHLSDKKNSCIWCGKLYEEHRDTPLENGTVPRMPCVGLKSGFQKKGENE